MPHRIGQSLQSLNLSDLAESCVGDEKATMATLTRQYRLNDASSLLNRMTYLKGRIDAQKEPGKHARLEDIEKEAQRLHANLKDKLEANETELEAPAEMRELERLLDEAHACSSPNAYLVTPINLYVTTSNISLPDRSGRVLKVDEWTSVFDSNSSVVHHKVSLAAQRDESLNRPQSAAAVNRKQVDEACPTRPAQSAPVHPRASDGDNKIPTQSAPIQPRASDGQIKMLESFRTSNPYSVGSGDHHWYDEHLENLQKLWLKASDEDRNRFVNQAAGVCRIAMIKSRTWDSSDEAASAARKLVEDVLMPDVVLKPEAEKPPFDLAAAEEKFKEIVQSNPYKSDHAKHRSFAKSMARFQSQWTAADVVGKERLLGTATNALNYARRNAA